MDTEKSSQAKFRSAVCTVTTVGIFTQHQAEHSIQTEPAESLFCGTDQKVYFWY